MTGRSRKPRGPAKVALARATPALLSVGYFIAWDNGVTADGHTRSLTWRGAQREITMRMVDDGWTPVGRWTVDTYDGAGAPALMTRLFREGSR